MSCTSQHQPMYGERMMTSWWHHLNIMMTSCVRILILINSEKVGIKDRHKECNTYSHVYTRRNVSSFTCISPQPQMWTSVAALGFWRVFGCTFHQGAIRQREPYTHTYTHIHAWELNLSAQVIWTCLWHVIFLLPQKKMLQLGYIWMDSAEDWSISKPHSVSR